MYIQYMLRGVYSAEIQYCVYIFQDDCILRKFRIVYAYFKTIVFCDIRPRILVWRVPISRRTYFAISRPGFLYGAYKFQDDVDIFRRDSVTFRERLIHSVDIIQYY